MATPSIWAQILTAAGLQVTPNAQEALACWSQSEGGLSEYNTPGDQASGSINNPFNITARYGQPGTAQGGSQGNIQYFNTLAEGIAAAGQWLKSEAYLAPVRAALNSGDITQMYTAINGVSGTLGGQSTPIPGYPPVLQQYIASGGKTPASGVYSTGVNPPPVTESQASSVSSTGTTASTANTNPQGTTTAGVNTGGTTTATTTAVDYTVPAGGWDWSVIPPDQMKGAMGAINLLDGLSKDPAKLASMETQIEEDYPQYAYLWDIPAFKTILTYGALAQLTSDRVFGLIQATPYWHDHSTGAMWWAYKTQSSPKDAQAMIGNTEAYVRRLAATLGIDPSNAEVQKLSHQAMQDSWTTSGTPNEYADSTIIQSLVNNANIKRQAGAPTGDVATLSDYLQTLSSHYMLGLDRSAIDALIQKAMKSDTGEGNFITSAEASLKQQLQQQAVERYGKTYPGIAQAIGQGASTAQYLQLYRNTASDIQSQARQMGIPMSGDAIRRLTLQLTNANAGSDSYSGASTVNTNDIITAIGNNYSDVTKTGTGTGGDVSTLADQFRKIAGEYGYPMTSAALNQFVEEAMKTDTGGGGFTTGAVSAFEGRMQTWADNHYANLNMAGVIAKGGTPTTFLNTLQVTRNETNSLAQQMGIKLTPGQIYAIALKVAQSNAANGQFGSDPAIIDPALRTAIEARRGTVGAGGATLQGDAATLGDALEKLAGQYLYPMTNQKLDQLVQQALAQDTGGAGFMSGVEASFEQQLKTWASTQYQKYGMSDAIAKGETPSEFMNVLSTTTAEANKIAASLGINLSRNQLYQIALKVTQKNAENGMTGTDAAVTDPEITTSITSMANIKAQGGNTGGDVSTLADSYQKIAGQYLQSMTPAQLDTYLQNSMHTDVGQGNFTTGATSAFEQQMKNNAITKYPYMKEQIAEGTTPAQFIAPYATAASNLLEIAPTVAQSELANGKLSFALEQKDPKTGAPTPMSIADFKQELMSNPQYGYQYTDQAVKSAYTIGAELARSLGVISGGVA